MNFIDSLYEKRRKDDMRYMMDHTVPYRTHSGSKLERRVINMIFRTITPEGSMAIIVYIL